jgi:hypothetical protein
MQRSFSDDIHLSAKQILLSSHVRSKLPEHLLLALGRQVAGPPA